MVRVCTYVDVKLSNSTTGLLLVCMGTMKPNKFIIHESCQFTFKRSGLQHLKQN